MPDVATLLCIGVEPSTERRVYLLELTHIDDFPMKVDVPGSRFVLLHAADTKSYLGDRAVAASRILTAGCVYFCAWGPGCKLMHDVVDERVLEEGLFLDSEGTIMTTWHDSEPLSDAVEFALLSAEPDGIYRDRCDSVVLATVGNPSWSQETRRAAAKFIRKADAI